MGISIVNGFAVIGAVIVRAAALLNIAAAGTIFIIVADVVDVILSSHTSEYRRHVHFHHRRMHMVIGIEDTSIDAFIGRAAVTRTMCFATQVAGGRAGCLREQWR